LSEAIGEAGEMPHKFKIGTVVNRAGLKNLNETISGDSA